MSVTVTHEVEEARRSPGRNHSTHYGIEPKPTSNGKIRMRSPSSNAIIKVLLIKRHKIYNYWL